MKIIVYTDNAKGLYDSINYKIKKGELKTWEIKLASNNEVLYNHSPEQWSDRVLLMPNDHIHGIVINTKSWSDQPTPDEATKGYIIGRFVEILMVHFRGYFTKLEIL